MPTRELMLLVPRPGRIHGPAVLAAVVLIAVQGCATTPSDRTTSTPPNAPPDAGRAATTESAPIDTQASAARLHEIAGSLLLYHVKYQRLPARLTELTDDPSLDCPPLVSPESGRPYVYHMPPRRLLGRPGALLIHDPTAYGPGSRQFGEPVHWALLIDQELASGPIGTQVIFVAAREIRAAERPR